MKKKRGMCQNHSQKQLQEHMIMTVHHLLCVNEQISKPVVKAHYKHIVFIRATLAKTWQNYKCKLLDLDLKQEQLGVISEHFMK